MEEKEEKKLKNLNPKPDKNQEILAYSSEKSAKQEQIHDLLFSKEIGWQEIIYDLINTGQLDPWDVDITLLTNKYLEKLHELEEDYFISSKVLLAAALLLRIKSEILLNKYIKSIDEILFGKKDTKPRQIERIELEDEIPELIPKSPLPRFKKVTLKDLIESLNKAIITENRRIKRKVIEVNAFREAEISMPKKIFILKDKIKEIYEKLLENFKEDEKVNFKKIAGNNKEEKIIVFSSLLHLENQKKIWIEQKEHFGDIHIWLKKTYFKKNDPFKDLREEE
ncbi:MAG: segregation/condensation protein A [Nanoarchaeota archaeon]|nr:segregation/condensation protein A [Nanoarchaeota archaeon]